MARRTLHGLKRLANTADGNPRLEARFVGDLGPVRTAPNSQAGVSALDTYQRHFEGWDSEREVEVDVAFADGVIVHWEEVQ